MYPVKKGLGNAYKWGNNRDTAKDITVEAVVTKAALFSSISDEGDGFDAEGNMPSIRRSNNIFHPRRLGLSSLRKTRSMISYANGGRTLHHSLPMRCRRRRGWPRPKRCSDGDPACHSDEK